MYTYRMPRRARQFGKQKRKIRLRVPSSDKDAPELVPATSKGETQVHTTVANENPKIVLQPSDVSIPEVVRASYATSFGPRAAASQGALLMSAASVSKSANVEADVIKATRESPPGFATNLEDIASSLEIPQAIPLRIGLEGDPGIGKTLFCQRIALRWTLGMLDHFDLVLMVDVSSVTTSLCDYLYGEHFGSDSSFITPDAFWDYVASHQENVLLLVDGLEILTQKQLHNLGFFDIFVGGALERSHVIITARSGLRTTMLMKVCDFVYILQGPTTVAKVDYVRSYFVEKTTLAERLVAEIETNPQLLELASNPSCLALLCHLQVGQDSQPFRLPTTVTELYTEVFRRLLLSPCSTKPYILEGDRMWKDIHIRLMALGQIAWEELKCNRTTFSVHNLRDTYKVLDRLLPMGVLRIEQQYERGVQNELVLSQKCSFINRTWQEYFAAFYVGEKAKSQPNSRQTTQYLQACLERDNSLVCLFTAGHMKSKASPLIRTIEREIKFYRKEIERVPKSREAELRLTDLLRMGLECLQECRAQTNFVHILAQFFTEKLHITEKCTAACLYSIADVLKFQGAQKCQKDQVFVNTLQISVAGRLTARLPMFFDALDRDLRVRSLVFEDNLNLSSARSCGGSISLDCRSLRRLLQRHKSIDEVSCNIDNITISRPAFGAIIDAMTASRSLCRANFKILYDYDSKFAEEFCSLPFEALAVSSLQEFSLELEESCFSQVENESTAENRLSLMSPVVRMLHTSPQMRKMSITIQDTEVHSEKPSTRAYTLQVIPLLQAVAGERTLQEFSLHVPRADILILTGTRDLVTRNVVLKKLHLTASETSTPRETTAVSEILRALSNNRSLQCFTLQLEDVPPSCNPNELLRDVTEVLKTNPILRTFSFVLHRRPLGLFCSGLTLKNLVEAVETNNSLTRVDIVGFYAQDPKSAKLVSDFNCATIGRKLERNLDIPYIWDACSLD
ncbi:CIITA [Branchiostoma lanceolatum]|uniref:CIITA protein n=1 Tax=Branchiostoma lanceolatum TaxID=7740 RepID=A0A8K0F3M7_BRALA|nr:CIITA [Branchiostoma lanceolatum]